MDEFTYTGDWYAVLTALNRASPARLHWLATLLMERFETLARRVR